MQGRTKSGSAIGNAALGLHTWAQLSLCGIRKENEGE